MRKNQQLSLFNFTPAQLAEHKKKQDEELKPYRLRMIAELKRKLMCK